MKQWDLKNFSDFVSWVEEHAIGLNFLFRGQSNSEWRLETTLEREFGENTGLDFYYRKVCLAKPQVETYTEKEWDIPPYHEYEKWLEDCRGDSINFSRDFKAYEFMAYLRHHGFPSPLLDWSRSPYVAAFFAFRKPQSERVAIYAYSEMPRGIKSGQSGKALIKVLGPYVRTHKRHFQQQSWYTICALIQPHNKAEEPHYKNHETVFAESDDDQDLLWKVTLPASERIRALSHLNRFNLNAFSLFGSEESLCETLAFNSFIKDREE
jgi:hypothetical protein